MLPACTMQVLAQITCTLRSLAAAATAAYPTHDMGVNASSVLCPTDPPPTCPPLPAAPSACSGSSLGYGTQKAEGKVHPDESSGDEEGEREGAGGDAAHIPATA